MRCELNLNQKRSRRGKFLSINGRNPDLSIATQAYGRGSISTAETQNSETYQRDILPVEMQFKLCF